MLPRRALLLQAAGGVAGVALLGTPALRLSVALAQNGAARSVALQDDLHVLSVGPSNVIAMTGGDGVVLVNGGAAEQSAGVLEAIAKLPGAGEIRTLFNTCWHPQHTGSNEQLRRAGATIIAHENTRLWLTQEIVWPWDGQAFAPLPAAALPNKTFYQTDELSSGEKTIQYGHVRACPHTDGDCYVLFRDANVLAVGEAVSGSGWPNIDWWTGGWIGGIVGGLESLLALADDETRIVPARGPVLRRADLAAQYTLFASIYEQLSKQLHSGVGLDEVLAARPLAALEAQWGPSDEFVQRAFESLWGYLAPDA